MESAMLERDLLPRIDLGEERRAERRRILFGSRRDSLLLAVLFFLAVLVLMPLTLRVIGLRADLARTERETADQETGFQAVLAADARTEEQLAQWGRFLQSRARRETWRDVFPTLAARIPNTVYLEQVQVMEKNRSVRVALQGSAETMPALQAFGEALRRAPLFSEISLIETAADRNIGSRGVRFQLSARVGGTLTNGAGTDAR